MKRFKINSYSIIFLLILLLLGNINLFSKEKDVTKDKKDKKDKKVKEIKDKKEKEIEKIKEIKEKKEKTPNIKDKIENLDIISEKIHTEKTNLKKTDKIINTGNLFE